MLLDSLEHIAYRLAGLTAVIWGLEKTKILQSIMSGESNQITMAFKTSAILSGSEFLSDHLLSYVTHVKVPSLWTTMNQLGIIFVANALVLLVMDKLGIDDKIVSRTASEEMKALQLSVLFIIVQEISMKFLHMYSSKMLSY